MSNSFRIEESELRGWHAAVASRIDLRGVAAVAKEMEAHLARKEADGTVVVSRHQLFTWAEALQGASMRDASAAGQLPRVVADLRSVLTGKPATPAQAPAPPPVQAPAYASFPAPAPAPVPPVQYVPAGAATAPPARVLVGADLASAVRELVRGAHTEVCVSAPWSTGVETLVHDLVALAPQVRVLVVSRRPDRDDPAFHHAMDLLGRRRAVTAFSGFLQTRMVVVDGQRAIVGAASVPNPALSREVGVLVTEPATVGALRAAFQRAHDEAAGGAPRS